MYQCDYCKYESMYKYNVDRHVVAKHKQLRNGTYHAHRNDASQPNPYVNSYLTNTTHLNESRANHNIC